MSSEDCYIVLLYTFNLVRLINDDVPNTNVSYESLFYKQHACKIVNKIVYNKKIRCIWNYFCHNLLNNFFLKNYINFLKMSQDLESLPKHCSMWINGPRGTTQWHWSHDQGTSLEGNMEGMTLAIWFHHQFSQKFMYISHYWGSMFIPCHYRTPQNQVKI